MSCRPGTRDAACGRSYHSPPLRSCRAWCCLEAWRHCKRQIVQQAFWSSLTASSHSSDLEVFSCLSQLEAADFQGLQSKFGKWGSVSAKSVIATPKTDDETSIRQHEFSSTAQFALICLFVMYGISIYGILYAKYADAKNSEYAILHARISRSR